MKFVGLLSGGKDSCYNIFKCISYGHELICLGNLYPLEDLNKEEVNSYMYQSAASNLIPAISICLNIPLIRYHIKGNCIIQSLDYNEINKNDEVEDLYELLKLVKETYPDVVGVSCGAIVSNYQRYRVENICERLGLIPLTYLWQRDRKELLKELIDNKFEAILVKVAGAGLLPEKHLGKSLSQLYNTIDTLHQKYQLDYCGEGGEYESFVLDCPLFKKYRIKILETEIIYDDEDPSVGNLKIISYELCPKEENIEEKRNEKQEQEQEVKKIEEIKSNIIQNVVSQQNILLPRNNSYNYSPSDFPLYLYTSSISSVNNEENKKSNNNYLIIDNDGYSQSPLIYPSKELIEAVNYETEISDNIHHNHNSSAISQSIEQLHDLFNQLQNLMENSLYQTSLSDIIFVHLYLSDINLFTTVNYHYCNYFTTTKYPPSRVCVTMPLPPGVYVAMDVIIFANSSLSIHTGPKTKKREVLYVKSLSEWAPLCIGPYSQANIINNSILYVAGQISLDPGTMKMINLVDSHRYSQLFENELSNLQLLSFSLRNEIYQSILNYSNIFNSLESSLSYCLSGIIYLSITSLNLQDLYNYPNISKDLTNQCLKYVRLCLKKIYSDSQLLIENTNNNQNDFNESGSESESGLEDRYNQDKDENLFDEIPIIVLFVTNLPRNALVEVEFISIGNNLNEISYNHKSNTMNSTKSVVMKYTNLHKIYNQKNLSEIILNTKNMNEVKSNSNSNSYFSDNNNNNNNNTVEMMLKIPIWDYGLQSIKKSIIQNNDDNNSNNDKDKDSIDYFLTQQKIMFNCYHENILEDSILDENFIEINIENKFLSSCLSTGFIHILLNSNSFKSSTSSSFILLNSCITVLSSILEQMKLSNMSINDLKFIKIYYPSYLYSYECIKSGLYDAFILLFNSTINHNFLFSSIQIIPVYDIHNNYNSGSSRGNSSSRGSNNSNNNSSNSDNVGIEENQNQNLFSAYYYCLNLLQIQSELWIARK